MEYFQIDRESFKGGYYYSISELVSIYLCDTEYLLHFSGDTRFEKKCKMDFVATSIEFMKSNSDIAVVNPVWSYKFRSARLEAFEQRGDMLIGYGFSDQCYLIRTQEFKRPIYNEKNAVSERYPKYGGELFEKRCDAYMRNKERLRATYCKVSYLEENIRKGGTSIRFSRVRMWRLQLIDVKDVLCKDVKRVIEKLIRNGK